MRRVGTGVAAIVAAVCAIVVAGCGGDSGGPVTLNYYGPLDPGGTNVKAAKECSEQSGGKYKVAMFPVGNSADATRELFVRRLAAGDKNMDILNTDTIYTPEFAEAGWLREMTGADKQDALDDVLPGPAASVTWKNKVYGIPTNTNVQLLWYRKDLVPNPPKTWDEMIAMAKKLPAGKGNILEQGQKYEGYVVWFNNLVASGGGKIVNAEGAADAQRGRGQGGADHQGRRDLRPRRPGALDRAGGPGPPRLRGRQGRLPAQLAVRVGRGARGRQDEPGDQEGRRQHGLRALPLRQGGRAEPRLDRRRQPQRLQHGQEPASSRPRPRCA